MPWLTLVHAGRVRNVTEVAGGNGTAVVGCQRADVDVDERDCDSLARKLGFVDGLVRAGRVVQDELDRDTDPVGLVGACSCRVDRRGAGLRQRAFSADGAGHTWRESGAKIHRPRESPGGEVRR